MADIGRGLSYGTQGAGLGASLGSVIPGVGTAIGAGVGGALGLGYGLFSGGESDDERRLKEYARELMSGKIDSIARNQLNQALGRRFRQLRRQAGMGAARRGLLRSSISQGTGLGLAGAEQEALANALAQLQFRRQALGAELLGKQISQEKAQQMARAQALADIAQLAAMQYFQQRNQAANAAAAAG